MCIARVKGRKCEGMQVEASQPPPPPTTAASLSLLSVRSFLTFSYSFSCHCSSFVQCWPSDMARYTYFIVALLQHTDKAGNERSEIGQSATSSLRLDSCAFLSPARAIESRVSLTDRCSSVSSPTIFAMSASLITCTRDNSQRPAQRATETDTQTVSHPSNLERCLPRSVHPPPCLLFVFSLTLMTFATLVAA
jgi:hypothetical protein